MVYFESCKESCKNCKFSVLNKDGCLECHRYCPQYVSRLQSMFSWPIVKTTSWCGEFKADLVIN